MKNQFQIGQLVTSAINPYGIIFKITERSEMITVQVLSGTFIGATYEVSSEALKPARAIMTPLGNVINFDMTYRAYSIINNDNSRVLHPPFKLTGKVAFSAELDEFGRCIPVYEAKYNGKTYEVKETEFLSF